MSHQPRRGLARSLVSALAAAAVVATGLAASVARRAGRTVAQRGRQDPSGADEQAPGRQERPTSGSGSATKADLKPPARSRTGTSAARPSPPRCGRPPRDSQAGIRASLDSQGAQYTDVLGQQRDQGHRRLARHSRRTWPPAPRSRACTPPVAYKTPRSPRAPPNRP